MMMIYHRRRSYTGIFCKLMYIRAMSSAASRYARLGFRELLPEHAAAVEAAERARGVPRLREMTDRSLGAAVFLGRGDERRVLLIEQISQGSRFWAIPKGHAEESDGGDDAVTAIRELREETGVDISGRLIAGVWAGSGYTFCGTPHVALAAAAGSPSLHATPPSPDEKVVFYKSVSYALADLGADARAPPALTLQAAEVAAAAFLPLEDALARLRYENDRITLRELAAKHAALAPE